MRSEGTNSGSARIPGSHPGWPASDSADDPLALPDLASRALRGSVIAASDEFFAEKENLIKPEAATYSPQTFGHKGQIYDGWETRRRRDPGGLPPANGEHDWVIVRLGAPGVVHAVVVDTAFFTGNFPQACSVEACWADGYPDLAALGSARWVEIVARSPLKGDSPHVFEIPADSRRRYSHVRLRIYPDGGVARLRVHGVVVPDPALLEGMTFDLAALENGADVVACSDRFYSSPRNVISPGLSRVMGEGWETRRRRTPRERVARRTARRAFRGLSGRDRHIRLYREPAGHGGGPWLDVRRQCDGRERGAGRAVVVAAAPGAHRAAAGHAAPVPGRLLHPVDLVRLDVFPDGGVARLRLYGSLTPEGLAQIRRRWAETAL